MSVIFFLTQTQNCKCAYYVHICVTVQYNEDHMHTHQGTHTCTHATSDNPLVLFDIRGCGSQTSIMTCFFVSLPHPPFFSYSRWCGETQPTPLFAPIPKEQQLLVVFCHLSFLSLWTKHKTMAHSEKALWVWSSQKKGFSVSAAVIGHIWMAWILLNIMFFILQIPTVCFKA